MYFYNTIFSCKWFISLGFYCKRSVENYKCVFQGVLNYFFPPFKFLVENLRFSSHLGGEMAHLKS